MSKLWATSMDHPRCGFVNHFLVWLVVFILVGISSSSTDPVLAYIIAIPSLIGFVLLYYMHTVLRLNMRRKHHVGNPQCTFGDCFFPCCIFTSCCSIAQIFRSVSVEDWDWFSQVQQHGIEMSTEPFTIVPRAPETFGTPGGGKTMDFEDEEAPGQTFQIAEQDTG